VVSPKVPGHQLPPPASDYFYYVDYFGGTNSSQPYELTVLSSNIGNEALRANPSPTATHVFGNAARSRCVLGGWYEQRFSRGILSLPKVTSRHINRAQPGKKPNRPRDLEPYSGSGKPSVIALSRVSRQLTSFASEDTRPVVSPTAVNHLLPPTPHSIFQLSLLQTRIPTVRRYVFQSLFAGQPARRQREAGSF
jgi:hypothetical protein